MYVHRTMRWRIANPESRRCRFPHNQSRERTCRRQMAKIDGSEEAFQDYGASVFALPFFNCCKLQIGVAIRSEMVVQIGGGNIGVKFCAGEVLGVGTTVQVVVIRHVNKDLVKSY